MNDLHVQKNVSLADHTTIGIGGPALQFVAVENTDKLCESLKYASDQKLPVLVLGGGSNMLISDSGWSGLVIKVCLNSIEVDQNPDGTTRVVAGGGEDWDSLVRFTVEQNLQGMECLSGIPGTVGASPIQNIGAYGQEVKDTIAWVEALDRRNNQIVMFSNTECGFNYRWSRFKGQDKDRYIVTRVAFDLMQGRLPVLRYGDLTRYFADKHTENPSLAEVREAVLEVRRSKGMVVDSAISDSRSCGSFFMNPVVSDEIADAVEAKAVKLGVLQSGQSMPCFPDGKGQAKLSAAWLMERSGLQKGFALGNVGLSSRHVLAIVNRGGGSSAEVLQLVRYVVDRVEGAFGITLHPEPNFIGFGEPK